MNGLYLPQPHADMIASGKKHYIAQGVENPELCGEYLLVTGGSSDGKVLGRVNVSGGESIAANDFDGRYREHRVPAYNRKSWWPDVQTLYLHKIESFETCEPTPIEVRPGVQTLMGELGLDWDDIKETEMPWKVFKKGDEYCVYKVDDDDKPTGSSLGCHPTREAARTQQAALYASESKEMLIPEPDVLIPAPEDEVASPTKGIEEDTKVGRRVRGDKVEVLNQLKTMLETLWKWATNQDQGTVSPETPEEDMEDDDDKKDYAVKVIGDYLILWPTNAFQDRELEIFTTKSIEDYIERHKDDPVKGRAMYRHWKGTDFGDIVYQAIFGRYLAEVAKFDDTPLGNAFKALFAKYPNGHPEVSPEGWGYSHGYKYNPADRQDKVYEWFDKDETSVLPASVASNPHNPTKVEVITMSQKSIAELSALIGEDLANDVAKKGESLTEEKERAGVAFKEAEAPVEEAVEAAEEAVAPEVAEPEAEAPTEEVAPETAEPESVEPETQVDVEQVVEAVTKALDVKALSDTLAAQAEAIKTLTAKVEDFTTRLATIEQSDEARLEQKAKEMPRFFWQTEQPSRSQANKVKDDDPIKAKVPVETPPAIEKLAERLG